MADAAENIHREILAKGTCTDRLQYRPVQHPGQARGPRLHHNPENSAFSNELNGLFFEENNAQSLAYIMDKLYNSPDKKLLLYSEESLKIIKENYSIDLMIENFNKSIRKIIQL